VLSPSDPAPAKPRAEARVAWRRLRKAVRRPTVWAVLAVIVVLFLSGVPVQPGYRSSGQQSPDTAVLPAAHASAASPATGQTAKAVAQRPSLLQEARGPVGRTLCLSGIIGACPSSGSSSEAAAAAAPAGSVSPLGDPPSSWKQLTPPAGNPNPSARDSVAEAYYPAGHEVLLFGGTYSGFAFYGDTWGFSDGKWTELISNTSCTPKTCPTARGGAMMAYDPAKQAMLLFGGLNFTVTFNDTWLFANNSWTNITANLSVSPSPRFDGSMTYDSLDNYILLYGGEGLNFNTLPDTWKFANGEWTNITGSVGTAPSARAGAAIADSPSGYIMLFGGEDVYDNGSDTYIITNPCNPAGEEVAWWFYEGKWSIESGYENTCIASPASPSPSTAVPDASGVAAPPCARYGAALGWSPKNNRFVLYGGYGYPTSASDVCQGSATYLNDTWSYDLEPGGVFLWNNVSGGTVPVARAYMGYATDYSDDYFEIFGGGNGFLSELNDTWRFYEAVFAKLTGPQSIATSGEVLFRIPYTVLGYGGTGSLNYQLSVKNTRNSNQLTTGVCDWFYNASSTPLPYNGTVVIRCDPKPSNFGIYRITLTVTDEGNGSRPTATANWTTTVVPPEEMYIYSEYAGYFYAGVDFKNTFTIYAEVANFSASSLTATIGGQSLSFAQSSHTRWWNATDVQMSSFSPGTTIQATADFSNWTENVTFYVQMISTPSWLGTLFKATGASQSISSKGAGPFNKTYTITEQYNWNLGNSTNFSIPVPLVGGQYGLIPSVNVTFNATSAGNLSVLGTLSLTPPTITIGPASLKITASIQMAGTFDVVGSGVQWGQAQANVQVSASLSASIPIYGFSLFGCNVGFTLQLTISPTITLQMILAPLQAGGEQIISGVAVEIQKFLGSFSLALSAAINFGIGIASIGLGVGLSVAVAFQLNPFSVYAGWVNGTIFVTAQFLWWSDSFNIVGPATVFSWGAAAPRDDSEAPFVGTSYDEGNDSKWTVQVEYYKASDYDGNVWNPAASSGPAISDIYPWTEVAGAAAFNGAYLFYTDDNTSLPESAGLLLSGARLNSTTNAFSAAPAPRDSADYELANPEAATLSDGSIYVVWSALPSAESSVDSPLNLTSIELQGADFRPNTDQWSSVRTFSTGGFAQSYQVDGTGTSAKVLELTSEQPFLGNKAPEHLVEYDEGSAAILANVSTTDLSEIVSFRAASNLAVVESLGGNFSLVSLPSGDTIPISYSPPSGSSLISATFAIGSSTTLVLLYREATASDLVVYDTATGQTLGTLPIGADELQAEGISSNATTYVFVRTAAGVDGWAEAAGTFTNLTTLSLPGVVSYGLVQAASSIVVYAIVPTGGTATEPIRELDLTEIGAALPQVTVPPSVKSSSSSLPASDYALYLGVAAAGVVALLSVVAVLTRRKPPASSSAPAAWTGPRSGTSTEPSAGGSGGTPPSGASADPPSSPPAPPTSG